MEASVREQRLDLWHGGAPGRVQGDLLLPPTITGVLGMGQAATQQGLGRVVSFADRVYVTTDRRIARAAAANWARRFPNGGRGTLYRVVLDDVALELDADLPRGPFECFQVERAIVGSVAEVDVDPDDPQHAQALLEFIGRIPR